MAEKLRCRKGLIFRVLEGVVGDGQNRTGDFAAEIVQKSRLEAAHPVASLGSEYLAQGRIKRISS